MKRHSNIFFLTQNSCWTKITTDHFSFKWSLKNYISSFIEKKCVAFSNNLRFEVTLEIPEDDIKIRIKRSKGFAKSQKLLCSVTLLDLKGEEADSKEAILEAEDLDEENTWLFPTFLQKSKITSGKDKYIQKDYFTLQFDFALSNGQRKDIECRSLDLSLMTTDLPLMTKEDTLNTDLKHALTDNIHSDVELRADDKVFRAHKVILCVRSPVFMTMFNQDMVENQTGAVNIPDVEAETLSSLLEFMYTGDTSIPDCESALKLLLAADKYQVLSLKERCSSVLVSLLSDENVCDILFTADLVQQESLKDSALTHIAESFQKILKSRKWKELAEKNLNLANETLCEVSLLLS